MLTDKEQKKAFKKIASQDPDRYYPTRKLKELGYTRKQCKCGQWFWTVNKDQITCGDPACSGGFKVTMDNPAKVKLSYEDVWNKIVELLQPRGYTPIRRYPVVSRWNPTTNFTIASISAFQPYVISGESEPPAKKLLIPQFCLRFNDVVNVGITGSHCTGFVMIGQHVFVKPEEWNQEQLFTDIFDFLLEVVGLPKSEVTVHEDAWAGGGNFGPCMEFFSRGVELFNQVYMMFEQTQDGSRDLKLKVLDMGLGMERVAWFSQGTPTLYDATFPEVLQKLREKTGVKFDATLFKKFSLFSAYLNFDEVDDINAAWGRVAKEMALPVAELHSKIMPMTALYSIAEHARALLFALSDGMLPSNVGGGYNLRVLFRRAMGFIDQMDWKIDLADVCEWHATELKGIFPEVSNNLHDVREILAVEKGKYEKTKERAQRIVAGLITQNITLETLIEMYDSKGINPEVIREEARKLGKKVVVPDDFYNRVMALHEQVGSTVQTHKDYDLPIPDLPDTRAKYFEGYDILEDKGKVLWVHGNYVVLDETIAYPTSGGQLHDIGRINDIKFGNVFKQKNVIVHELDQPANFIVGDEVAISVDPAWRTQLAQHHTATHIINAAARDVLGNHINQYGAKKTEKWASLDITHFAAVTPEQLTQIEARANAIVKQKVGLRSQFLKRREAENKYGMHIYQGGAVPGNNIRIVEIPGIDVEACGGTHLHSTDEVGRIKVINAKKIQDGLVRLTFTAGKALKKMETREKKKLAEISTILDVPVEQVAGRAKELFTKWKTLNKAQKSGKQPAPEDLTLVSTEKTSPSEVLIQLRAIFEVKLTEIPKAVQRFLTEWTELRDRLKVMGSLLSEGPVEKLKSSAIKVGSVPVVAQEVPAMDTKAMNDLGINLLKQIPGSIIFLATPSSKGVLVVVFGDSQLVTEKNLNLGNTLREVLQQFQGKGGGKPENGQGMVPSQKTTPKEITDAFIKKLNTLLLPPYAFHIECLWDNYDLIKKGIKSTRNQFFIAKSKIKIPFSLYIQDLLWFINVDKVPIPPSGNTGSGADEDVNHLAKFLKSVKTDEKLYIGKLALAELQNEPGASRQPDEMVQDTLNIIMLYFKESFEYTLQSFSDSHYDKILTKFYDLKEAETSILKELQRNFFILFQLRREQFRFIQKSLRVCHKAITLGNKDLQLEILFLVSSIEVLAEKYAPLISKVLDISDEKTSKKIPIHTATKELLQESLSSKIAEEEIQSLVDRIDQIYLESEFFQLKEIFLQFCEYHCPIPFKNDKLRDFLELWYYLRSKIVHAGEDLLLGNKDKYELIEFNIYSRTGRLKDEEPGQILKRIPPIKFLEEFTLSLIISFIEYLFKEKPQDTDLYTQYDEKIPQRTYIRVKGPQPKPGTPVFKHELEQDFDYYQAFHLGRILNHSQKIANENGDGEALQFLQSQINNISIDKESNSWLEGIQYELELLYKLERYDDIKRRVEELKFNQKNPKHWFAFNFQAYIFAQRKEFKNAHQVLDDLLSLTMEKEIKACLFDSKGDIFRFEGLFEKAIEQYEKSLAERENMKYYNFHKKTIEHILECYSKSGKKNESRVQFLNRELKHLESSN